jgi:hypothetical protein
MIRRLAMLDLGIALHAEAIVTDDLARRPVAPRAAEVASLSDLRLCHHRDAAIAREDAALH